SRNLCQRRAATLRPVDARDRCGCSHRLARTTNSRPVRRVESGRTALQPRLPTAPPGTGMKGKENRGSLVKSVYLFCRAILKNCMTRIAVRNQISQQIENLCLG